MRHGKRLAAVVGTGVAIAAATAGLTHHSRADDLLSGLGLDPYATEIAGEGIFLSPALTPAPVSPTGARSYATSTCGSMFPGDGLSEGEWVHVHITGFGWGPDGNLDRDAFVFGVNPEAVTGPVGQEDQQPALPQNAVLDHHHPAWLMWFVGIPDPKGFPCWATGGGA